jgi:PTS system fructose-specific IIA component/PTS system nitrogen regulatory IIA component
MSVIAVSPLLDTSLCILDLKSRSREPALAEIVEHLGHSVRDSALLRETLLRRERHAGTAIGKGVALPNARTLSIHSPRVVLARSVRGIAWAAADGEPVRLACAVLSPAEWSDEWHHELLARAAAPFRLKQTRQRLFEAGDLPTRLALWREALS